MTTQKTQEQLQKEFDAVVAPVIKWMNKNVHPHHSIIITHNDAELLEGQMSYVVKP